MDLAPSKNLMVRFLDGVYWFDVDDVGFTIDDDSV